MDDLDLEQFDAVEYATLEWTGSITAGYWS
jgi:hypothetical protein